MDSASNIISDSVITVGVAVIASTVTMIISSALIGFWMTMLLMLIGLVIRILAAFIAPLVAGMVTEENRAAISNKAGAAVGWVAGLFSSTEKVAA